MLIRYLTISIFLLIFLGCGTKNEFEQYSLKKGVLDLSDFSIEANQTVDLDGEWEFYWKQLLTPKDFKKGIQKTFIDLPKSWNGKRIGEEIIGSEGYATYRALIKLQSPGEYGIYIENIGSAYSIWINGEKKVEVGSVGKSRLESKPSPLNITKYFELEKNELELVIQVSNFHRKRGGIGQTITIGFQKDIQLLRRLSSAINNSVIGILFLSALAYLLVFLLQRKRAYFIHAGLFCLSFCIYYIVLQERLLLAWFPSIEWEILKKITYYSYLFPIFFFISFLKELFPKEFSSTFIKGLAVFIGIIAILILFTDAIVFQQSLDIYYIVVTISLLYSGFGMIKVLIKKRDRAYLVVFPVFFMISTAINDALYANEFVHTGRFLPVGVFVFVFFNFQFLASLLSRSFSEVEQKTQELEGANAELIQSQKLAEEKSRKFEELNEEYVAQLALLNDTKAELNQTNTDLIQNNGQLELKEQELLKSTEELEFKNKKLEQLNLLNTSLLNNLPYEFQRPIQNINSISTMLLKGSFGKMHTKAKFQLEHMKDTSNRLSKLIDNLMLLAVMNNKQLPLRLGKVDLNQVVEVVLLEIQSKVKKRKQRVLNQLPPRLPHVKADIYRLQQVLRGLFSQALQNTPQGEIIIAAHDLEDQIEITIMDNGKGLSGATLADEYNGKNSSTLELFVNRKLVELHGGSLELSALPEQGNYVLFTLPRFVSEEENVSIGEKYFQELMSRREENTEQPPAEQELCVINSIDEDKPLVFYCDADPTDLQVGINFLKKNYSIRHFLSGEKLLSALRRKEIPEVAIVGAFSSDWSGFALCQEIRGFLSREQLPLLMLLEAGDGSDFYYERAGVNGYLKKPLAEGQLNYHVREIMELAQVRKDWEFQGKYLPELAKITANWDRINWIRANRSFCEVRFETGDSTMPLNLSFKQIKEYFKDHPGMKFWHRSYAFNLDKIENITHQDRKLRVLFQNGLQAPISRQYYTKEVRHRYAHLFTPIRLDDYE